MKEKGGREKQRDWGIEVKNFTAFLTSVYIDDFLNKFEMSIQHTEWLGDYL